tara:strand:- start:155 stop:562 length:408 start_codon:yes stop_codon:yes gene_type:complete
MSVSEINFCIQCGNSVTGSKYCSKCGNEVASTVLATKENNVGLNENIHVPKKPSKDSSNNTKYKSKSNHKTGVFNFNSSDAKLLFWGILGIIGGLFLLAGEKVFESPQDVGFPIWVMLLIFAFIGWILAKSIDSP